MESIINPSKSLIINLIDNCLRFHITKYRLALFRQQGLSKRSDIVKKIVVILVVSICSLPAFAQSRLHRKAEKCYNKFEFAGAAITYEKIVRKNPTDHNALARLEQCYRFLNYKSEFKALLPTKRNQSSVNIPLVP